MNTGQDCSKKGRHRTYLRAGGFVQTRRKEDTKNLDNNVGGAGGRTRE